MLPMPAANTMDSGAGQPGPGKSGSNKVCAAPVVERPITSALAFSLGRLGRTRLNLSPAVMPIVLVVAVVVLLVSDNQTNADLPVVGLMGLGFWVMGWLIQLATKLVAGSACGIWFPQLTINLIGIRTTPRRIPAGLSFFTAVFPILALVLGGMFLWWAAGDFQKPVVEQTTKSPILSAPNVELAAVDSTLKVGAWLLWVQVLCHLFPLQRTFGRQIMASIVSFSSPKLDTVQQVDIFRRLLFALAAVTMVGAAALVSLDAAAPIPRWPMFFVLAILLWTSCRSPDLGEWMLGHQVWKVRPEDEDDRLATVMLDQPAEPIGWIAKAKRAMSVRGERRRVVHAMEQERREADDVARLDAILTRIHEEGHESLSEEDREILGRVSQSLRKERGEE